VGKHSGNQDNNESELQAKADEFDAQWQDSFDRAEQKRENGEYPYDLDPKSD